MSRYFLRLCRLAFTRLRYLCLLIFFRRFLITEPMQATPLLTALVGAFRLDRWDRPDTPPDHAQAWRSIGRNASSRQLAAGGLPLTSNP